MGPEISVMDAVGPVLGGLVFIGVMSLVPEPARHKLNLLLVAGVSGVYISGGGFGVWELAYPALMMPVLYLALNSYRWIGIGWLMHSGWDIAHYLWGQPIWPFQATSSFGCMLFDAVIALWFIAGARSVWWQESEAVKA